VIRLFVSDALAPNETIALGVEQSHFLVNVMRLKSGDPLTVFNGADGEWEAKIDFMGKRETRLLIGDMLRDQRPTADLDLIAALVKRSRLETIVEKATELGARRIRLVITERTNADHTNIARLRSIAIEAAEQCGRLDVPDISEPAKLAPVLSDWDDGRRLMFCDEAGDAPPAARALAAAEAGPWAILIGPEGGFSSAERSQIRSLRSTTPVSLGPRILRADSAAIAAMALWQSLLGEWLGA
jgi:16S rRNA (uracil1498-N3)-methyltransferase